MQLRRGTAADLDALQALEQASFSGDRLSRRRLRHHLHAASSRLWVAVDDAAPHSLLGYALLLRRRGSCKGRLYSIAVAAAARGRGVGRALLQAIDADARALALDELLLEVRPDNADAIRLYRLAGYSEFGRYQAFYEDGSDALRLRLPLEQAAQEQADQPSCGAQLGARRSRKAPMPS